MISNTYVLRRHCLLGDSVINPLLSCSCKHQRRRRNGPQIRHRYDRIRSSSASRTSRPLCFDGRRETRADNFSNDDDDASIHNNNDNNDTGNTRKRFHVVVSTRGFVIDVFRLERQTNYVRRRATRSCVRA